MAAITRDTLGGERVYVFHSSLFRFIATAAVGTILWFGGREVLGGRLSTGELVSFIL